MDFVYLSCLLVIVERAKSEQGGAEGVDENWARSVGQRGKIRYSRVARLLSRVCGGLAFVRVSSLGILGVAWPMANMETTQLLGCERVVHGFSLALPVMQYIVVVIGVSSAGL